MDNTTLKELEPFWENWYIDHFIGEGSFGKVYKICREEFGEKHYAALKIISIPRSESEMKQVYFEGMNDESASQYFSGIVEDIYNEIVLMSKLKGKTNIVSYEDHNIVQRKQGVGYDILIRMELLTSLNDYVMKKTLSNKDIVRMGIEICNALSLCEKRNIIHRDIKPDNIFLSNDGDFKLGDFGIAKQMDEALFGLSIKGSYEYMAPEVYNGKPYDHRVDIYSLGLLLYTFLNNRKTPFVPTNRGVVSHGERQEALKRRFLGEQLINPVSASEELSAVVLKACAYKAEDRYSSSDEFRMALESLSNKAIGGEPSVSLTSFQRMNDKVEKAQVHEEDDEDKYNRTVMLSHDDEYNRTVMLSHDNDYDKTVMLSQEGDFNRTVCLNEDDNNRTHIIQKRNPFIETVKDGSEGMVSNVHANLARQDITKRDILDQNNSLNMKKQNKELLNKVSQNNESQNKEFKNKETSVNKNGSKNQKDCHNENRNQSVMNSILHENIESNKVNTFEKQDSNKKVNNDNKEVINDNHQNNKSVVEKQKKQKGNIKVKIVSFFAAVSIIGITVCVILYINRGETTPTGTGGTYVVSPSGTNIDNTSSPESTLAVTEKPKETISVEIEPVKKLTIELSNKKLTSLENVKDLENVTDLILDTNKISDISALEQAIHLVSLSMLDNNVADITVLENKSELEYLFLSRNEVKEVSALSNLTKLTVIYLDNNKIKKIDSLKGLTQLTDLYLNNNNITDITALKDLTKLSALNLAFNDIKDISPLYNLTNLQNLDLTGNQISKSQQKKLKSKLPDCNIIKND